MRSQDFIRDTFATIQSALHPLLHSSMDVEGTMVPSPAGALFVYEDTRGEGDPVVLVHSVNAAASSYEVRPLFEALRGKRPVLAFDLPGFGRSQRGPREYDRSLYREAVIAMIDRAARHRGGHVHVVALSLGCEFAAAAALERPEEVRSLAFISPTGLGRSGEKMQQNAASGRSEKVLHVLSVPLLGVPLFGALVSRPSIHYFLAKSFVGAVDAGLARYSYLSAHQPGARYAPFAFLSGKLFDPEVVTRVYGSLRCPVRVIFDKDAYTDFALLPELARRPDWSSVRVTPTLGLPQFEQLPQTLVALRGLWAPLDLEDARMEEARPVQPGF